GRAGGPRGRGRLRGGRLAEDLRLPRHAHLRPDPAALDVRRSPLRGGGAGPGDRAAGPPDRHVPVVEGGAARRLRGLQPERQGPHGGLRLLGQAHRGRPRAAAGVSARVAGDEVRAGGPEESTIDTMRAGSAERGDPAEGMDDAAGSLEQLLDLAAKHSAAGLPDAPWPPMYDKQEGEA